MNDLLDYTQIMNKEINTSKEFFNLLDVIHDIVDITKSMAEEKGLKFILEVDQNLPL